MKEKEFSRKSWHYRLYMLMYGKTPPQNLCPYFWKGILPALLMIIPLGLICAPFIAFGKILDKMNAEEVPPQVEDEGMFSIFALMAIVFDFAIFVLYCMIAMWFYKATPENTPLVHILGLIGWFVSIIITVVAITEYIRRKRREKRHKQGETPKPSQPNILVESLKAWYKKYCPTIKWKD